MIHSKQILSITNAAVDALSSANHKGMDLKRGSLQTASTSSNKEILTRHLNSPERSNSNVSCSSIDDHDRVVQNTSREMKDTSSSSLHELSFNGTQRVKVPSRLLREIKSPLERSSSSSESKEIPGVFNIGEYNSNVIIKNSSL